MRKLNTSFIVAAIALFAGAAVASAQTVEILPQIGITSLTYSGDGVVSSSTGVGFEVGGKVRIGSRFYVEPGIFWATSAADVDLDLVSINPLGATENQVRISDVRVPLVLGLKVVASRVLELRIAPSTTCFWRP